MNSAKVFKRKMQLLSKSNPNPNVLVTDPGDESPNVPCNRPWGTNALTFLVTDPGKFFGITFD